MENKIIVNTKKELFPAAPDLYGLFFEDINRAGDGGLYPEMIRNRSFEDSLTPAGCTVDPERKIYKNKAGWPGAFNHGEGMDDWAEKVEDTPVPGWYADLAVMEIRTEDTLNPNREAALQVSFSENGKIWNIGYAGVPVKDGDYVFTLFIKSDTDTEFTAALESKQGTCYGKEVFFAAAGKDYQKIDGKIHAEGSDFQAVFSLTAKKACTVMIGFTSLLPEDTYLGHGLRRDLVEFLKGLSPKFMRFPGGCIVEGLTEETAMRFSHTIGPVWERPSHQLMWHYRTTNGLGFHEYLQLCEDLGIEAMYVCNCGISCQARRGRGFSEDLVKEMLMEADHAIEYAIGSEDTEYGKLRAAAGHPEPFSLKYVEIGNENWGEEYLERYELFYRTLKEKYPDIIYISNGHTEREQLPTEVVDEHYYNAPEWFLENDRRFDSYDRNGPKIFLGEYAVNGGNTIASMECALAEAVFLTGVEKNQDIVTLSAYAPLFQNSDYTAWKPNLIVFDNHQVYGIPSYHVISLFGRNQGDTVVECRSETEGRPPVYRGIPGLLCEQPGLCFKNAKIDGKPVSVSRTIYGSWEENGGIYEMRRGGKEHPFTGKSEEWNRAFEAFIRGKKRPGRKDERDLMWVTFDDQDREEYTFEIDLKFDPENAVTLSVWNSRTDTDAGCSEPKDKEWNLMSVRSQIWKMEQGFGVTDIKGFFDFGKPEPEKTALPENDGEFHTYKIKADHDGYQCYIDDKLVQQKKHILHPLIYSAASTEGEKLILKLVHVGDTPADVSIVTDCEIEKEVRAESISAELSAGNDFEHKERVAVKTSEICVEGSEFIYHILPHSVDVLTMKRAVKK